MLSFLLAAVFACAGVDDTAALQAAVDAGDVEISGDCLIRGYPGIRVPSNRTITAYGATLRQTANQGGTGWLGRNRIFETIPDSAYVTFRGGLYIGQRAYVGGLQWSIGIRIDKASHVLMEDVTFQDWYTDGFTIGGNKPGSHDVTIRNVLVSNSRRNGLSIASGTKIRVYNSIFETTNCNSDAPGGVCTSSELNNPMCGVDFEPNDADDRIDDVVFIDNIFRNNQKCGIFLQDKSRAGTGYVFANNTFTNNGGLLTNDFQFAINQVKRVTAVHNKVSGGTIGYSVGGGLEDVIFAYNEVIGTSGVGLRYTGAKGVFANANKLNGEDVFYVALPSPKMNGVDGNVCLRPNE